MKKNQNGFSIVRVTVIIAAVVIVGTIAVIYLKNSGTKPSTESDRKVGTPVNFEGQVTQIINQGGETCLTYQIDRTKHVAVMCPDMAGYQGFTGEYDKTIAVGDRVMVRANLKSIQNSSHQTYHLNSTGTYLRKM